MIALAIFVLAAIETLAAYISRIYAEFGKILSREVQENLDAWEERIEPHIGLTRDHAALCAAVLQQLALRLHRPAVGRLLFLAAAGATGHEDIAEAVLALILVVVFCNQLDSLAALQPHARAVGGALRLAHPVAALDRHAHHRLHPLLLFRGGAGRASRRRGGRAGAQMSTR